MTRTQNKYLGNSNDMPLIIGNWTWKVSKGNDCLSKSSCQAVRHSFVRNIGTEVRLGRSLAVWLLQRPHPSRACRALCGRGRFGALRLHALFSGARQRPLPNGAEYAIIALF